MKLNVIKQVEKDLAFAIYCQDWISNPENDEEEDSVLEQEIETLSGKLLLLYS